MIKQDQMRWRCLVNANAKIGECPSWDEEERSLYWIDVLGPSLHRTDIETGDTKTWHLPRKIGSFAIYKDSKRALLALDDGIYSFHFETGKADLLVAGSFDTANYRFNDGRCDRNGRFWVGTARNPRSKEPDGGAAFYRLDRSGLLKLIDGTTIANGLAWSPDGRTMYIADRPNWQILAFDYEIESGTPSNPRVFVKTPEGEIPDGAAVDAEGCYWIAMHGSGRILRFRPDGRLDRELKAPTDYPTMIAFGGRDMKTMFVTTATVGYAAKNPGTDGGGVFQCELDIRGLPAERYVDVGVCARE